MACEMPMYGWVDEHSHHNMTNKSREHCPEVISENKHIISNNNNVRQLIGKTL